MLGIGPRRSGEGRDPPGGACGGQPRFGGTVRGMELVFVWPPSLADPSITRHTLTITIEVAGIGADDMPAIRVADALLDIMDGQHMMIEDQHTRIWVKAADWVSATPPVPEV